MTDIRRFAVLAFALVLAGQGCLSGPGAGEPETAGGSDAEITMGDCSHQYMPLAPGSSITYRSSATGEDVTYTQSVASNAGDQASLTYTFSDNDLSLEHNISCTPSGIFSEGYLDLNSITGGVDVTMTTRSSTGPLLPEDMSVGSSWENQFVMVGTFNDPSLPVSEFVQNLDISRKVIREGRVTVPAGTYDALVVEASFNITSESLPVPPMSFTQTEYWVKGIGMVKTEGSSPGGGNFTTEAVSVTR